MDNLLDSWEEFLRGKRRRADVAQFALHLMDHVVQLHHELATRSYRHGPYHAFKLNDPKPRDIHKASVRDRLVHHAIYRVLYPEFDRKFIHDSYSCRRKKGTHRAMDRFGQFARKVSRNDTRTCWVLQCDIRKFFANIDHAVLLRILCQHIADEDTLWLLGQVISSFQTPTRSIQHLVLNGESWFQPNVGLPLGNLTSQLLVNIYMNEFDHWMKRTVKAEHYIRYADDFVILHHDRQYLADLIPQIAQFLDAQLRLSLHPKKVTIQTLASGIDFLGWVHFPHHRVLRTSTKRRMLTRVSEDLSQASLDSYLGLLSHGNAHDLSRFIRPLHAPE